MSAGKEVRVSSEGHPQQELAVWARPRAPTAGVRGHCPEEDILTDRPRNDLLVRARGFERNVELQAVARDDRSGKDFAGLALELGRVARVAGRDVR